MSVVNYAAFESIPTGFTSSSLHVPPSQLGFALPQSRLRGAAGSFQILTPGLSLLQPQIHLTLWVQPPPRSMLSTG